ncbi:MAG: HD domain-containing protein [Candidatus Falkowbacteria bacterium]
MSLIDKAPQFVLETLSKLEESGFEAYIVGGCVRDLLMERMPKDWDITTNARPEQVLTVFAKAKYENDFGTVLLPLGDADNNVLEITTYRSEAGYADRRHPDQINFEDDIEEDLHRRDFTINAMAVNLKDELVDLFGGYKDIRLKIIRAVGEPTERFKEDALRMIRAIRFSCQLDFSIEPKTERGIMKMAGNIKFVAKERIHDELVKIIASPRPYDGVMGLHHSKLLQYIIPELEDGVNVKQFHHHVYPVFQHNLLSLKHCPNNSYQVRLAALLHDVGKPKVFKLVNGVGTFYNHEYVGAKMADKILRRLKFSNEDIDRIVNLVRNHMFYYNVGEVTEASVRRLIVKTGRENLKDLIDLRVADRLGSGDIKPKPYKLRHLEYMLEKVQHDPISVKMLKINGTDLMETLKMEPGPKIGVILDVLLSEVIEDPELNNKDYLADRSLELNKLDLAALREKAREKIEEQRVIDDQALKKDFKV